MAFELRGGAFAFDQPQHAGHIVVVFGRKAAVRPDAQRIPFVEEDGAHGFFDIHPDSILGEPVGDARRFPSARR
jgi:hypothetical protein